MKPLSFASLVAGSSAELEAGVTAFAGTAVDRPVIPPFEKVPSGKKKDGSGARDGYASAAKRQILQRMCKFCNIPNAYVHGTDGCFSGVHAGRHEFPRE